MKLRTKLTLAFLVMSVVPLSAIVLYSYYSSLETLRMAALGEVAELTAEIGDRVETIRQDVGRGVERLSTTQFGYRMADNGESFLSEVDSAMGAAAPFIESLEFMPLPPEPEAPAAIAGVPTTDVQPDGQAEVGRPVESVVIHIRQLAERLSKRVDASEEWIESEEGQKALKEIRIEAEVAGREVAQQMGEFDVAHPIEETRQLEEMSEQLEDQGRSREVEGEEHMAEVRRRVPAVEPLEVSDLEMIWQPNLLELEEVERLEERDRESRMLLGRDFDSSVEQQGRMIGHLRAQVSAKKVLRQVLHEARRDKGEIPFAIDGEGNLYLAREEDRTLLEDLPLLSQDSDAIEGSENLDDWVIVRLNDRESELVYGIARPIGQSLADLRRTAGRNLAAGLGLVALALLGIGPLSRRITRDLHTLTEGAEQLATGNLNVRVPVRAADEVGHLARSFNQMAEDLQQNQHQLLEQERLRKEQELEHRLLEAENSRKGRELEDARLFQLSLLPKHLPEHPQLQVSVFMRTATEVGGDYYDFSPATDGALIAAIGDATGHGARAGTMVTVIKSLFSAQAGEVGLADFLTNASRAIRKMELGRMAMALTLIRFQDGALTVAAAGMPPILIHRAMDAQVEELVMEGVPLGSMAKCVYAERRVDLKTGDTVLLMSDGFPELTNDAGEPLSYAAVHELFQQGGGESPEELISRLATAADEWAGGSSPSDDVTFVAFQVTG